MKDSVDELQKTLVYLELKINKQRAILSRMESSKMEIVNAIMEAMSDGN